MDLNATIGKLFLLIALARQQMFPDAAAEPQIALTCNVTQQAGFFHYQLSRPSNLSQCNTLCWEDQSRNVLARDSNFNPELVKNLTNQSIILKNCSDYLRFTKDCKVWEEAHCRVNCSLLLDLKDPLPNTVNSTFICITRTVCTSPRIFWLCITAVILLVVFVLGGLFIGRCRRRSAVMRVSYAPANQQIQIEREEVRMVNEKVNITQPNSG
ncbi:uncharacterized protein LOC121941076 isoform X1 [Plectropomus leopardus]|uniref:uncharacterized protein LOC121941076 isoform X1 n=1 Tax=Plectropomus leopardus TaxID=160734 RepID=UPI001C4BCD82|nr:uncharacterized protein LOC121941076 isoform X1 [Plectropomus leopardus]